MGKWKMILLLPFAIIIVLVSPMIFLGIFSTIHEHKEANSQEIHEKKSNEYLDLVSKILEKEFKLTINKNLYKVEYVSMMSNNFYVPQTYVMQKRTGDIVYKSNYLYSKNPEKEKVLVRENDDSFLISDEKSYYKENRLSLLLAIVDRLGFRGYVLNDLLYDKSKGNDFSEIEKIFNNYKKGEIYRRCSGGYNDPKDYLGELENEDVEDSKYKNTPEENGFLFYNKILDITNDKEHDKFLEEYGKRLRSYFTKERNFEEIDWYEFMKYNNLKPRITFVFENVTEEELESIRKKIKPYYNEKDLNIILKTNS